MNQLFITSTVRSGGSLLARLFDHHPQIASYPFELHLPMDDALHPSLLSRGEKSHVQNYPNLNARMSPEDVARRLLLHPDPSQCQIGSHFRNGKLCGKTRHMDVPANFDHAAFMRAFLESVLSERSIGAVYERLHRAMFDTWDFGAHRGNFDYVCYHRANGLFCDADIFFREFPGGFMIQPVRSLNACLVSEKRKVVSQLVAGSVARGISNPGADWVLRRSYGRFIEMTLVNWLIVLTRSVILKERYGERYLVFRYEDLVRNPKEMMQKIAKHVGISFHEGLTQPTNAGHAWGGNSMFGQTNGISAVRADTGHLLNETEVNLIRQYGSRIMEYLESCSGQFIDYKDLDRGALFDYDFQARYFDDREKTALYFASLYERWHFRSVQSKLRLTEGWTDNPERYFL